MADEYVPPTEEQLAEWRELARKSIEAQRAYQREFERRQRADNLGYDDES